MDASSAISQWNADDFIVDGRVWREIDLRERWLNDVPYTFLNTFLTTHGGVSCVSKCVIPSCFDTV